MEPAKPVSAETRLRAEHSQAAIAARLAEDPQQWYLRDFVYGSIDGLVTTFAVVSGALGAGLATSIVLILGFVNLVADGFSMAVSNFLGTKADRQVLEKARATEEHHIDAIPVGEQEEVREIFRQKGFDGEILEHIVEVITADRQLWVDTMLREEWGLSLHGPSPVRAALVTFAAFVIVGLVPLLPFLVPSQADGVPVLLYVVASLFTAAAFFGVGTLKSFFVSEHWFRSGLETLLMGGAAAFLAWLVGYALRGLA